MAKETAASPSSTAPSPGRAQMPPPLPPPQPLKEEELGSPNPNGRAPIEGEEEEVDMIVKMKGNPEEILQKLREAGLMKSAVVDTVIMHSDKARLQLGTKTIKGRQRVKERSYFGTPLLQLIMRRSSVLTVLMFLQSLSSFVLTQYEELIQQNVFLALFLTMLTGTGGNAGNQSSSMIIRGMSTGEINDSNMMKAFGRELLASSAIGLALAFAAFGRVMMTAGADTTGATVVSIATFITVVLAISGGTLVPLVVERMGGDPAVTSSPILATLTDVIGVLVLCVISSKMLAVTSEF